MKLFTKTLTGKRIMIKVRNVKFQWKTRTEVQVLRKHISLTRFEMSQKCGINIENFWGQIQEPGIKQKCFSLQLKMMLQEAYFEIFPRSDTRACPQRLASNRMDWPMQKTFPRISNNNINNNNKNNRSNNNNNNNNLWILKMGCLRNFLSLRSIPI